MRQKLLLLLLGVLSALPALARDFEYTYEGQTITYTVINEDDKTCMTKEGYWQLHGEIIYYCGNNVNGDLVLPDHPKDGDVEYTLTQIGQISFYGCKSLTSVVIPSSVRIIDKFAFTGCRGLKKAEFSNIESLCNISFGDVDANPLYYAEHLYIGGDEVTELVIPESVTSIGAYAFYNCSGLKSVVIGNSVKTIGKSAFYGCSGLTSVEIGNSVEWIGNQAFYECSSLESVVIGNSVETIGDKAFYNCSSLTSLEIPNSVTTIDRYAFEKCRSLTSVVLGNSVEGIGDQAFAECRGLTSLVIPNSVKTIGKKAFYSCSGMTSVVIGKSVRSIGSDAFNGSNLKKSAYPNSLDNPFYSSIVAISYDPKEAIIEDGWIWGPEKTAVYFAPLSLEGEYLTPESVQTIDRNAFYGCSGLTSVVIPNSVKTIGWSAFKGCSGLKKSAYPNSLKNPFEDGTAISYNPEGAIIEDGWIWGPEKTSVYFAPLSLEGEYTIPESVTSIGESAFYGCSGLTSVTALSVSPAAMDDDSFQGLYDTVKLTVPDDAVNNYLATKWGLFKNIQNNSGKELGYFSDGVLEYRLNPVDMTATVIGAKDNSNLQIPERFTDDTDAANLVRYIIKGIEYKAFDGKDVASVEFNSRSKMEYIGDYAFANTKIPSITLPETMKSIGEYAFHNVSDLKEVVLNEGLTQIGDYSFAGTRLTSISIPGSVKAIGDYAFYDTRSLSKIELPEGIETIGEYSFATRSSSDTNRYPLYIPSSVQSIGEGAFQNFDCSQVNISDLTAWCRIDFGSYHANPLGGSENGLYINEKKLTELQVPEGLKEVKPYTFYNCKSLKKVTFPEGLETIGTIAFYGCVNVANITIPSSVIEIGSNVFGQAYVTFADGLLPISLGERAFYGNVTDLYWGRPIEIESQSLSLDEVSSLRIGDLITEIPDDIFKDMKKLKSLVLGNSVEIVGNNAFSGCTSLTDLNFVSSAVQTIGDEAFSGCTRLDEVILPPSVETIGASAFAGDSSLEKIIMGHKVKSIGEKAFDGCKANTVSITAQTPPTAPNNTFSVYSGKLYVQGEKAKDAYYDAFTCWDRFDSYVMIDAEKITVEGADKISGKAGDTFQLTASIWPENVTLPQIFWRTTNPEIATVDENGLVTLHVDLESLKTRAQGEGDIDGACTIIAETLYNDGPVAQIDVTAEEAGPVLAESLTIDPTEWNGIEGGEFTIKATVLPVNAENKAVTFESSNTSVATVDAEGNVKVLKAGSCVITVSTVDGSNLKAECVIMGLSGVDAIFADPNASVDVYDMNGILLKKACSRDELKQLKPAVYILRSADTVVKAVVND